MNASLMAVLTDSERLLVAETEPGELAELDEDAASRLKPGSGVATNTPVSIAGRPPSVWLSMAVAASPGRRISGRQ